MLIEGEKKEEETKQSLEEIDRKAAAAVLEYEGGRRGKMRFGSKQLALWDGP